jgi:hypothetical protein
VPVYDYQIEAPVRAFVYDAYISRNGVINLALPLR